MSCCGVASYILDKNTKLCNPIQFVFSQFIVSHQFLNFFLDRVPVMVDIMDFQSTQTHNFLQRTIQVAFPQNLSDT